MPLDPSKVSLDPRAKALLDFLAKAERIPIAELTPAKAREEFAELSRRTAKAGSWDVAVEDRELPGPAGALRVRLYRPRAAGAAALPALAWFHGGGFCTGSVETHDAVCRQLADEARCAVLSVDYRLAPEHRFPAAVEDCFAAVRWARAEAPALRLDPARLAVGGDSGGGNLAAVVALLARDAGIPLAGQLLVYPNTDATGDYPSRRDYAEGFLLTGERMRWFSRNYLDRAQLADWRSSPARAPDLSRLPPALLLVGECDPLRDEGRAYVELLRAAGNDATFSLHRGQIHGFYCMGGVIPAADRAVSESAAFLRRVLG